MLCVRVKVEGIDGCGMLAASKLEIKSPSGNDHQESELLGLITSVDSRGLSLVLRCATAQRVCQAMHFDSFNGTAASVACKVNG